MSRSRRYTLVCGITLAKSDRQAKKTNNRKYRKHVKDRIRKGIYHFEHLRTHMSVWEFPKEGKSYFGNSDSKTVSKFKRK